MPDAKPLSEGMKRLLRVPPASPEQIKGIETAWENIYSRDEGNFHYSYEPLLLATIRRDRELIRWLWDNSHGKETERDNETIKDILEILGDANG